MLRSLLVFGALALPLLVGSCQPAGGGLSVTATDYKFDPPALTVKAGQAAQVSVRNTAGQIHDWTVQGLDQPVTVTVQAGQTGNVTFTPSKPGTYRVVCGQPGHELLNMVGQLIVQ